MKNKVFVLLALMAGLMLQSCSIQDVEMVSVNDFTLSQEMSDNPRLTINATLDNPNKFNIKVKKARLNLLINAGDAGNIVLEEAVVLEKQKQGDYEFILSVDKKKVLSAITASGISIAMTGKLTLHVKGWVKGKAYGLGKKIRVDEKKNLSLNDLGIKL